MKRKNSNDGEFVIAGKTPAVDGDLLLNPKHLLPGDVLLYRPRNPNWIGKKISEATNSPYTHAAIYLGEGVIADSNPPMGVAKGPLINFLSEAACVAALRSQLGFGPIACRSCITLLKTRLLIPGSTM